MMAHLPASAGLNRAHIELIYRRAGETGVSSVFRKIFQRSEKFAGNKKSSLVLIDIQIVIGQL